MESALKHVFGQSSTPGYPLSLVEWGLSEGIRVTHLRRAFGNIIALDFSGRIDHPWTLQLQSWAHSLLIHYLTLGWNLFGRVSQRYWFSAKNREFFSLFFFCPQTDWQLILTTIVNLLITNISNNFHFLMMETLFFLRKLSLFLSAFYLFLMIFFLFFLLLFTVIGWQLITWQKIIMILITHQWLKSDSSFRTLSPSLGCCSDQC